MDALAARGTRFAQAFTPSPICVPARAAFAAEVAAEVVGPGLVDGAAGREMGAEDFAYFVTPESGVKGVYFSVGGTPPAQVDNAPGHHSPLFRITPEPAVTLGVEGSVLAAEALMPKR
jgi:hippurate hydrolase